MERKQSRRTFRVAQQCYRAGDYQQSLEYLSRLKGEFPENFNILYPILLCHEKLGNREEACELCEKMLKKYFGVKERAKLFRVYSRLSPSLLDRGDRSSGTQGTGQIPDQNHISLNASGIIQIGGYWFAWKRNLLALFIIGCVTAGLVVLPIILNDMTPKRTLNNEGIFLLLIVLHFYLWNCIASYAALWASNNLVHEDLLRNILDAFFFVPAILLVFSDFFWFRWTDFSITDQYSMSFKEATGFFLTIILFNAAYFYFFMGSEMGGKIAGTFF